jgi:hypothetical protein
MTTIVEANPRDLLTPEEHAAVVATVLRANPDMPEETASRIVDQALAFVATAATTDHRMAPSRVVDEGWHALILHTRTYARLCNGLGRMVHHLPQPPDAGRAPRVQGRPPAAVPAAGWAGGEGQWRPGRAPTGAVRADCQHSPSRCEDQPCETPECDSTPN